MTTDTVETVFDILAATAPEIRSILSGRRGQTAGINPTGDTQVAADVMVDDLLVDRLADISGVGEIATEERDTAIDCGTGLALTLDPLDGSSNLASNNPMGTIVGIYDASLPAPGTDLIAAGSMVFGPITTLTTAVDSTVTEYEILDGERHVAEADVSIPTDPVVYGFGGGDDAWPVDFAAFADTVRQELKLRYGGAFVADINQVLEYGGIFAYPALKDAPDGKLRLQFEGNPIAYIIEAAGGHSSDGTQSILNRQPTTLHDRVPVHVGNRSLIDQLEAALD